jgi:hypothetical protein
MVDDFDLLKVFECEADKLEGRFAAVEGYN